MYGNTSSSSSSEEKNPHLFLFTYKCEIYKSYCGIYIHTQIYSSNVMCVEKMNENFNPLSHFHLLHLIKMRGIHLVDAYKLYISTELCVGCSVIL